MITGGITGILRYVPTIVLILGFILLFFILTKLISSSGRQITNKCPFCNKRVWFWDEKEWYEITPDWGLFAHKKCRTKKNHLKFLDDWFKECSK